MMFLLRHKIRSISPQASYGHGHQAPLRSCNRTDCDVVKLLCRQTAIIAERAKYLCAPSIKHLLKMAPLTARIGHPTGHDRQHHLSHGWTRPDTVRQDRSILLVVKALWQPSRSPAPMLATPTKPNVHFLGISSRSAQAFAQTRAQMRCTPAFVSPFLVANRFVRHLRIYTAELDQMTF
jgi:hypothetical protein